MKIFTNLLVFLFVAGALNAQTIKPAELVKEQKGQFEPHTIFTIDNERKVKIDDAKLSAYTLLDLDLEGLSTLRQSLPKALSVKVPLNSKHSLNLQLVRVDIFSDDFTMIEEPSGRKITIDRGTHYHGIIAGKKKSLVAISIYENEIGGFISDAKLEGNYVLGKYKGKSSSPEKHVLYLDTDMVFERVINFDEEEPGHGYEPQQLEDQNKGRALTDCVRLLLELDFNMYNTLGANLPAANNYITTLFNGQAALYGAENINTVLSQTFIWTGPSPYTGTTTAAMLLSFQQNRNNFNADFANLLTNINFGGLAATIGSICAQENLRMCVSGVINQIANVPTYTFDMEVTAHEYGHLFGSFHTHGCYWNGNNTQIDDCGSILGSPEGAACFNPAFPIIPPTGGTIMSYCYNVGGVGVNFANGFGLQPGNAIRNAVANANCLSPCGNGCGTPQNLAANNVTSNSATLAWGAINTATSYNVQYRKFAGGPFPWINAASNTNSLAINNLTPFTPYEFRVQTVCNANTSAWSPPFLFWTLTIQNNCGNDIWENAVFYPPMQNNVPTFGLICPLGDVDFQLIQNGIPNSTITVTLDQLPADYDLELRDQAGNILAGSYNGGPIPEVINYPNAQPGFYYPYIMSNTGAWNPGLYFRLTAVVTPPPPANGSSNAAIRALQDFTSDLKIYPNPAQDKVMITFNNLGEEESIQLNVLNVLGQSVKTINQSIHVGFNQFEIDISDLENGSYFIRSTSAHILREGSQLIIQH
ncbi:MAG: M12 family metallo-peptidase [Bacteroidota bacterium]